MQLSYMDLISPLPTCLTNIGHIKSPKLIEIANLNYDVYNSFLAVLLMTPEDYYKHYQKDKLEYYRGLSPTIKAQISIYDLMIHYDDLCEILEQILNFFFIETVVFNDEDDVFYTYQSQDDVQNRKPVGFIDSKNYSFVSDIILQRNSIVRNVIDEDVNKIKNKKALEIYLKLKKGQEQQSKKINEKKIEIPNLISAMSIYHNNLNITNIWDLTVYQLYDQFQRQQLKQINDIQSTSVSVWGDEKNKFDFSQWYKTLK